MDKNISDTPAVPVEPEVGSTDWFLARDGGTPEEQELKRKAWNYMEYGAYDRALEILWKHFPDEYPIPECEREIYAEKDTDSP